MEETGQPTAFDEDPAAAFMAREQEDLAGIADDTLGSGLMVKCYCKKYNSLLCGLGVAVCKLSFHSLPGRTSGCTHRRRLAGRWK